MKRKAKGLKRTREERRRNSAMYQEVNEMYELIYRVRGQLPTVPNWFFWPTSQWPYA